MMWILIKKYSYCFLIILLLVAIFTFSSQNGLNSNMISMKIAERLREYTIPVATGTNIKLTRVGNTVLGYYSAGNDAWVEIGRLENSTVDNAAYIGIVVASLNNERLCRASLSNVQLEYDIGTAKISTNFTPTDNRDIGTVSINGSMDYEQGIFSVKGSGSDIWNAADEFHYAYVQTPGDFSITAKVDSIENTHTNAKAGIMIRKTLDANSDFVDVVVTPMKQVHLQWRNNGCISSISKDFGSKTQGLHTYNFIVRKLSHFFEFFILALCVYGGSNFIKLSCKKRHAVTFMFCVMIAFLDEFHQIFVSQRISSLWDVTIDASGSIAGIFVIYIRNAIRAAFTAEGER